MAPPFHSHGKAASHTAFTRQGFDKDSLYFNGLDPIHTLHTHFYTPLTTCVVWRETTEPYLSLQNLSGHPGVPKCV
jgi:hypothetical protein